MKVTTVVELLLILLLVAFAAYGRVIEHDGKAEERAVRDTGRSSEESNAEMSTLSLKQATDTVNRYCTCNENICNCCRDFHIPLVQLQGPGCASLQYLQGDELAVQLSFGNNILTSTIVNGKTPRPVCVPLPGGFTKFCGRIYSIKREARNNFKACLGLELQSATEIEASLRVGCFRFGPDGVNLRPAEPLPLIEAEVPEEEEDDDDLFGLGSDDDEEDEDADYDAPLANSATNSSAEEEEDEDDDDVLGFGALLDIITGDDETATKKPKVTTAAPLLQFTIPILPKPTSSPVNSVSVEDNIAANDPEEVEFNQESSNAEEEESDAEEEESVVADTTSNEAEEVVTVLSNKIASSAKPDKLPTKKFTPLDANKKKPSITSSSVNAIENEVNKKKKPLKKPVKGDDDDVDDILEEDLDDDDDDDEDEELLDSDDDDEKISEEDDGDEKVDEDEQENHEDEDEKTEVESLVDDDDDDDDEEEDAVISALVYDEKTEGKKKGKVKKHYQTMEADDDDSDYGLGLTGLLARSRHSRNSHQSKDVRL